MADPTPPIPFPWSKLIVAVVVVAGAALAGLASHMLPINPPETVAISLPESVEVPLGKGAVRIDITTLPKFKGHVRPLVPSLVDDGLQVIPYPDHYQVVGLKLGLYEIGVDLDNNPGPALWTKVFVKNWGPTPIPPDPIPPKPPEPPQPPPIPASGFRVCIIYESSKLNKLPSAQVSIITAKAVRDYLALRCAIDDKGRKEFRFFDQDDPPSNISKVWQDAMARPRASLPWIICSNGLSGYEGPLPATVNATLELLKRFGGV